MGKVRIKDGQTVRGNCPFCNGRNTFTLTKKNGDLIWNCYRASCMTSGSKNGTPSLESIRKAVQGLSTSDVGYPIPSPLTGLAAHPDAFLWLAERHCTEAISKLQFPIRFSPTEDRIMFPVIVANSVVGYSGRSLDSKPKWKKYGDCTHLLTCGSGSTGVVVEDAASACAVGVLPEYTGASLLGTSLTDIHKSELLKFDRLLVCLDPDASLKGLKFTKSLSNLRPTELRIIPNDLKYYSSDDIRMILSNNQETNGTPDT